jgi:hypothetical protein
MEYIIEIVELDVRPDEWTNKLNWPGDGIYSCKDDTSLYDVGEYGVSYIPWKKQFMVRPVKENELSPQISEPLLLKAIAAASLAQTLK